MAHENVSPNKITETQQRRADHIKDRLEDQGMGRDDAEKRALAEVAEEGSGGGGSAGGEPKKGADHQRDHRRGSDKDLG